MAKLEDAMPYLLDNEGEFANTAGDAGGETLDGIARREHPEWPGWKILDALNLPLHDPCAVDIILKSHAEIEPLVSGFYLRNYWLYDGLLSQPVATKLLDGAVNMEGNGRAGAAITALQKAIHIQQPQTVLSTGYGPMTEAAANRCDADGLLEDLARQYVLHYQMILQMHPTDEKFRGNWMHRAAKLPTDFATDYAKAVSA